MNPSIRSCIDNSNGIKCLLNCKAVPKRFLFKKLMNTNGILQQLFVLAQCLDLIQSEIIRHYQITFCTLKGSMILLRI